RTLSLVAKVNRLRSFEINCKPHARSEDERCMADGGSFLDVVAKFRWRVRVRLRIRPSGYGLFVVAWALNLVDRHAALNSIGKAERHGRATASGHRNNNVRPLVLSSIFRGERACNQ